MKNKVIEAIEEHKIIAILRGVPKDKLIATAEALHKGGIRLLEITYSANGSVSDCETAENIKALSEHFKGKLYIGAGTVLTPKQVRRTKASGGFFIISPNTDKKVIRTCNKCGLVSIPGALTPSEIVKANQYGADFIKLFPIEGFGTEYVKAVRAPLSDVKFLAVGGINENNMAEYLSIEISGFGIGSNIINKKMIANDDWSGITDLAAKYTKVVNNA